MDDLNPVIFVAGAHGVGKSQFCSRLSPLLNATHLTASSLIRQHKDIGSQKAISGIEDNQTVLVSAVNEFKCPNSYILLDGHICLFNEHFELQKLPPSLFLALNVKAIIVLRCPPTVIYERLNERDGHASNLSIESIELLQRSELQRAEEISHDLKVEMYPISTEKHLSDSQLEKLVVDINRGQEK